MYLMLALYSLGFGITLIDSGRSFLNFQKLKRTVNVDIFAGRPDMKFYLIAKPIFWPYYFVTEKSPIERFSEFFFKTYGDEGHRYFGHHGLKNFINDVWKGKNRYRDYAAKRLTWPIEKNTKEFARFTKSFGTSEKSLHASIIYAEFKGIYLLGVTWGNKEHMTDAPVSRFELDGCERMSRSQFMERLFDINEMRAKDLFQKLTTSQ